jgi:hypothetical protein
MLACVLAVLLGTGTEDPNAFDPCAIPPGERLAYFNKLADWVGATSAPMPRSKEAGIEAYSTVRPGFCSARR